MEVNKENAMKSKYYKQKFFSGILFYFLCDLNFVNKNFLTS